MYTFTNEASAGSSLRSKVHVPVIFAATFLSAASITSSLAASTAKYLGLVGSAVPPIVAISSSSEAYGAAPGSPTT